MTGPKPTRLEATYMRALVEVDRELLHRVHADVDGLVSDLGHHVRVLDQRVVGHLQKSLPLLWHLHCEYDACWGVPLAFLCGDTHTKKRINERKGVSDTGRREKRARDANASYFGGVNW